MLYTKPKTWRIGDLADVEMLEEMYEKLKKIMNQNNDITWEWIEKETGISARTIRRWMNGKHRPHPVLFMNLKKVVERLYALTS